MTDMTLIEQNKILAKFMGYEGQHEEWCGNNILLINPFSDASQLVSYDPDSNWNQLMPIVEKLESSGFAIHIDEDRVFLHFPRNHEMMDFTKEECGSKIATVYKAVCAGVEWVKLERLDKTAKAL